MQKSTKNKEDHSSEWMEKSVRKQRFDRADIVRDVRLREGQIPIDLRQLNSAL